MHFLDVPKTRMKYRSLLYPWMLSAFNRGARRATAHCFNVDMTAFPARACGNASVCDNSNKYKRIGAYFQHNVCIGLLHRFFFSLRYSIRMYMHMLNVVIHDPKQVHSLEVTYCLPSPSGTRVKSTLCGTCIVYDHWTTRLTHSMDFWNVVLYTRWMGGMYVQRI